MTVQNHQIRFTVVEHLNKLCCTKQVTTTNTMYIFFELDYIHYFWNKSKTNTMNSCIRLSATRQTK